MPSDTPSPASAPSPEHLLLQDYRPRSIYRIPETTVPRARFDAIDMHSHAYAGTPEEIERWLRTMDEVGIERTIVMTSATGAKFEETLQRYRIHADRFSVWCGVDFTGYDRPGYGPAAVAELERCFEAGAEGVGELGDKGNGLFFGDPKAWGMHFDDPRMDPLLQRAGELGLPVNIHVAEPIWMYEPMDASNDGLMNAFTWRQDDKEGNIGHAALIMTLENAVRKHPGTVFIACHFANCCYDLHRLGGLFDRYPNLYADISARYAETAPIPRFMAAFYATYQDRLLYGTDMGRAPEMYRTTFRMLESADEHFYDWELFTYHWPLHGLALPDEILRKLYADNARALFQTARR